MGKVSRTRNLNRRYIMEQFWTIEEEFFFTAIEEKMDEEAKEESE